MSRDDVVAYPTLESYFRALEQRARGAKTATCKFCGQDVTVGYSGHLYTHRDQAGRPCKGSQRKP